MNSVKGPRFVFAELPTQGDVDLEVRHEGFKSYLREGIKVGGPAVDVRLETKPKPASGKKTEKKNGGGQ